MCIDKENIAPWSMIEAMETSSYNAQGMPAMLSDTMDYQSVYPDVYYKVMPFVMMACDEMDAYGCTMPHHEMVRQMSDRISQDVERMHPELAGVQSAQFGGGIFNDLITILLLNEFFNRRRRY